MNSRLSVSGLLLGACLFAGVPFSAQAFGALLKSSSEITALSVAPRKQKQAVNLIPPGTGSGKRQLTL